MLCGGSASVHNCDSESLSNPTSVSSIFRKVAVFSLLRMGDSFGLQSQRPLLSSLQMSDPSNGDSQKKCPVTKFRDMFSIKKYLPLRVEIPFTKQGLVFVDAPQQIEQVIGNPFAGRALSDPRMPQWLNSLFGLDFNFVLCPIKKYGAIFTIDKTLDAEHGLYRQQRRMWFSRIGKMSEEDIDVLSDYLVGKISKEESDYQFAKAIAKHFTKHLPTKEDTQNNEIMRINRLSNPKVAQEAREKLIEWAEAASQEYNNIEMPEGADPQHFKNCLAADIFGGENAIPVASNLLSALKNLLESKDFDVNPEDVVKHILIHHSNFSLTFRVATDNFSIPSLPFEIKKNDMIVPILVWAREASQDIRYRFLGCPGKHYVINFLERVTAKAIEKHKAEVATREDSEQI